MPPEIHKWLHNLQMKISALTGFKGAGATFGAGILLVLAMPPAGLWALIFAVYPVLYWRLLAQKTMKGAFWTGWLFGFAQFLVGFYWMGAAFLVEADKFLLLMPFAVTLLPMGLGLFHGLALALWFKLKSRFSSERAGAVYLFIILLCLSDFARGHVLTGLPWNLAGMAFLSWLPLAQSASLWGVYGLTLLVIWVGCLAIFWSLPCVSRIPRISRLRGLGHGLAILVFLPLLAVFGVVRLSSPIPSIPSIPSASSSGQETMMRIVQPSIAQKLKWQADYSHAIIDIYLELSARPSENPPQLVIFPETALPFLLEDEPYLRQQIAAALPPDATLVTGSLRRAVTNGIAQNFNSLLVLQQGAVVAVYDKVHLVPFGEYLPLQAILKKIGLGKLTQMRGSFSVGSGRETISLDGLPSFSPLICYEVIFPAQVVDTNTHPNSRPDLMINVTNDGWFGRTAGPHQHLALARMRSVEEGLPLVRAANTGISAVIDAKGRVLGSLPINQRDIIDIAVPPALEATIYARFGEMPFLILVSLFATISLLCRRSDLFISKPLIKKHLI